MNRGILKIITVLVSVLTIIMALAFASSVFARGQADGVESRNIAEADGTSGQDTNSGTGVKTGHIQDGAVTDAKIAGPISGSKLGNHTHNGSDITDGTISTSKITDGAITDAKITGPISSSKISSIGLDADSLDGFNSSQFSLKSHNHDDVYRKHYNNVIVVSQDGNGDFTNPVTAVYSITDASVTNPYLVKIMPGIYNIGRSYFILEPYIDIEGSGENMTTIIGSPPAEFVINARGNNEIRSLTVENTGGTNYYSQAISFYGPASLINVTAKASAGPGKVNVGVSIVGGSSSILKNVTAVVTGSGLSGGASNYGISISASNDVTLNNVTIEAVDGYPGNNNVGLNISGSNDTIVSNVHVKSYGAFGGTGISISSSSSTMLTNSTIIADTWGILNGSNSNSTTHHSTIEGQQYSLYNHSGSTFDIGVSQVDGPIMNDSSVFNCFNVYDGNFMEVVCP